MHAPTKASHSQKIAIRSILAFTFLLTALGLYQFASQAYQAGLLFLSRRYLLVFSAALVLCLAVFGILIASFTPSWHRLNRLASRGIYSLARLRYINLILFALLLIGYCYLILYRHQTTLPLMMRLSLFWLTSLAGYVLLKAAWLGTKQSQSLDAETEGALFIFALLISAAIYRIAVYLTEVNNYPFTLDWSEASRYYYASLYFSKQIYGIEVPPTVLHPSRYLMQALPFLLPGSPLWLHRLWQVLLWVGVTTLTGWLLARRLNLVEAHKRWAFICWTFLFLLVGPVYYHLQVAAIIVLAGFRKDRFWLTTACVLLGSLWAGISRINWFPVPGIIAATLYFLETPIHPQLNSTGSAHTNQWRTLWRYLRPPLVWGLLGTITAFVSQAIYISWSGNATEQFASSFSSNLLWYRLLPNPTYPMGVLPGAILLCLPMVALIYLSIRAAQGIYHWLRLAAIIGMLLVLFAGGLVVSTKIGGGSNLHNLDAFLTLLMIILGYTFFGKQVPDASAESPQAGKQQGEAHSIWHLLAIATVLLVSIYPNITNRGLRELPSQAEIDESLQRIIRAVESATQKQDEVLFIGERQLLTFGVIRGVKLVPDYERVFLMEMVMSGNQNYLNRFHQDLKSQRFDVIISEPLYTRYKGNTESFGEENDAWVRYVSEPILCYYEVDRNLRSIPLQILAPRQEALPDCP